MSTAGITEVLPDVPQRASRTIRGRVKVSVRVIVEQDGTVFAALTDEPGPSKYFERLAIDAAKKWTFAPASSDAQRLMQLSFEFTRDGTTARAITLQ
jgi:TonB family protein